MSEEKLYVVEDGNRLHLAFNDAGKPMWFQTGGNFTATDSVASMWSLKHGGHVVTLIEEPKKVVVSPEEAKLVKNCLWTNLQEAFLNNISLLFRGRSPEDVTRLKSALTNGYTVPKEKRYLVELDGLVTTDGAKQYLTKKYGKWFACRRMPGMHQDFTGEELNEAPDWARQLSREEVTDDDND